MATRVKVTLSGTTFLGRESFSWGVNLGLPSSDPVTPQQVQSFAEAIAGGLVGEQLNAWMFEHADHTAYTDVNVQYYATQGPAVYSGAASVVAGVTGPNDGQQAPQIARVVSLLTGAAGRRFRGRIYLPAGAADQNDDGTSQTPGGYLTSLVTFLSDLEASWPGVGEAFLGVYSAVEDVVTPVTQLRVGNRLDVQRRRADELPETYATLGYP